MKNSWKSAVASLMGVAVISGGAVLMAQTPSVAGGDGCSYSSDCPTEPPTTEPTEPTEPPTTEPTRPPEPAPQVEQKTTYLSSCRTTTTILISQRTRLPKWDAFKQEWAWADWSAWKVVRQIEYQPNPNFPCATPPKPPKPPKTPHRAPTVTTSHDYGCGYVTNTTTTVSWTRVDGHWKRHERSTSSKRVTANACTSDGTFNPTEEGM